MMKRFFRRSAPQGAATRAEPPVAGDATSEAATRQSRVPVVTRRRGFQAARPDRLAGLGQFGTFATSPREEVRRDLRGLVEHSRFAGQNSDLIRSYEKMVRRHVVGRAGIRLQMDVRDTGGQRDTGANDKIEAAWARWGRRGNCTVCGKLSWWKVEAVAATMLAREGNFLLRCRTGPDRGPFGFQVQVLSLDLLDMSYHATLRDGGAIDCGVEYNGDGRVLAFHMWTTHPAETIGAPRRARVRVPAAEMVHVFRSEEAMQNLGLPETRTTLRRVNIMNKYEEAALTAAHYGAANMVFFESEDADGMAAPDAGGPADAPPIDQIEAGTVLELPPGVKVADHSPSYPDAELAPFMRHMTTGAGAGLGVSYSALTGDMSQANFSSLRDGRGEERDEWRMFQRDLYEGLHDQVFQRWLPRAILAGQIALPLSRLEKFNAATWRPRGWPSVNPKDDALANQSDLDNGLRAPSDIVAERGDDYADVVARIAADRKLLEDAGVSVRDGAAPTREVAGSAAGAAAADKSEE